MTKILISIYIFAFFVLIRGEDVVIACNKGVFKCVSPTSLKICLNGQLVGTEFQCPDESFCCESSSKICSKDPINDCENKNIIVKDEREENDLNNDDDDGLLVTNYGAVCTPPDAKPFCNVSNKVYFYPNVNCTKYLKCELGEKQSTYKVYTCDPGKFVDPNNPKGKCKSKSCNEVPCLTSTTEEITSSEASKASEATTNTKENDSEDTSITTESITKITDFSSSTEVVETTKTSIEDVTTSVSNITPEISTNTEENDSTTTSSSSKDTSATEESSFPTKDFSSSTETVETTKSSNEDVTTTVSNITPEISTNTEENDSKTTSSSSKDTSATEESSSPTKDFSSSTETVETTKSSNEDVTTTVSNITPEISTNTEENDSKTTSSSSKGTSATEESSSPTKDFSSSSEAVETTNTSNEDETSTISSTSTDTSASIESSSINTDKSTEAAETTNSSNEDPTTTVSNASPELSTEDNNSDVTSTIQSTTSNDTPTFSVSSSEDVTTEKPTCKKHGKFPIPNTNCKEYLQCVLSSNGFLENRYKCPIDYKFDPIRKICSKTYVCPDETPEATQKTSTTTTTTNTPTTTTTTDIPTTTIASSTEDPLICTSHGKLPIKDSKCTKYLSCILTTQGFEKSIIECPLGTLFNPKLQKCNSNYVCTETLQKNTLPESVNCETKGKFLVPNTGCKKYIVCVSTTKGLEKLEFKCPSGYFNPEKKICSTSYVCPELLKVANEIVTSTEKNTEEISGHTDTIVTDGIFSKITIQEASEPEENQETSTNIQTSEILTENTSETEITSPESQATETSTQQFSSETSTNIQTSEQATEKPSEPENTSVESKATETSTQQISSETSTNIQTSEQPTEKTSVSGSTSVESQATETSTQQFSSGTSTNTETSEETTETSMNIQTSEQPTEKTSEPENTSIESQSTETSTQQFSSETSTNTETSKETTENTSQPEISSPETQTPETTPETTTNSQEVSSASPIPKETISTTLQSTEQSTENKSTTESSTTENIPSSTTEIPELLQCTKPGKMLAPNTECTKYILCTRTIHGFRNKTYSCPKKYLFNSEAGRCTKGYKCPETIITTTESTEQTTLDPEDCLSENEQPIIPECTTKGKFPIERTNCEKYILCTKTISGLKGKVYSCPGKSKFNPEKQRCLLSYKCPIILEPCKNKEKESEESEETEIVLPKCKEAGRLPIKNTSCKKYLLCTKKEDTFVFNTYDCPKNAYFDPELKKCSLKYTCLEGKHQNVIDFKNTINCPTIGKFPNEDDPTCKQYYNCINDTSEKLTGHPEKCNDDSLFDPEIQKCSLTYICKKTDPILTETPSNNTIKKTPKFLINGRCTTFGRFQIPGTKCKDYMFCNVTDDGSLKGIKFTCPTISVFNQISQKCTTRYTCPENVCNMPGFVSNPNVNDCSSYIECEMIFDQLTGLIKGYEGIIRYCPSGCAFDPTTLSCNRNYICPTNN